MSNLQTQPAWEMLFNEHNILSNIDRYGYFVIKASQIKKYREPRLMVKFDHSINLPKIFKENRLSILPITSNSYMISNFLNYHNFEDGNSKIKHFVLPELETLNIDNIFSESIAINCAYSSGILKDFLEEETILNPTVSGKMSSGVFNFKINNIKNSCQLDVAINNARIEIDAAFEGLKSLSIIEAKCDISNDFIVRQLYFPFRAWKQRVTKLIKPIFLVYSNGIFDLYEYAFRDVNNYNSIEIIKHQKYSLEDTKIDKLIIENIISNIKYVKEKDIPFPQADSFDRVVNLCEILYKNKQLSHSQITEKYAFDKRQTDYYTNAGIYLDLIEKTDSLDYKLSNLGNKVIKMIYIEKQIKFCELILRHAVFGESFKYCLQYRDVPQKSTIVEIMKKHNIYNVDSESTYKRRASTVKSWIDWIIKSIK